MSAQARGEKRARRVGYARVSTDKQTLYQHIDALKAAQCDEIFTDWATRATAKERPGLREARAKLKPGDTFVVLAIDRAFRSAIEGLLFLDALDKQGISFHSIYQQIDTRTPEGRKHFAYSVADAEYEVATISRRTKEKMAAAKRRGQRLGRPHKLSERRIVHAHRLMSQKGLGVTQVAAKCKVAPITLRRAFKRLGLRNPIHERRQ